MTGIVTILLALTLTLSPAGSRETAEAAGAEVGIDVPDLAALRQRPNEISYRDTGSWADMLNQRLTAAGFHADTGNQFGRHTRHAVYAFQKHHGLETTGVFTAEMWDLLDNDPALTWRREATRVEVDLDKQVLYLIEDREVELIIPISSGNGGTYLNKSGNPARARTPEGKFDFQWQANGVRISYLGELYRPFYFSGGYAIHGSPSVPNHAASHGCVRVTNWDMDLLRQHFELGQTVYVYGKYTANPPRESAEYPLPDYV
jgi:peptidoglycan hydrolase-like protein with peptidoglycan-binding domain